MASSNFIVNYDDPNVIIVIDMDGDKSVTNDAENVVEYLRGIRGPDFDKERIIYRDSTGTWDGIRTINGQFADFVILDANSREEALRLARIKEEWR